MDQPRTEISPAAFSRSSFWNDSWRPFFLAALAGALSLALWLAYWSGHVAPEGIAANASLWHGHEMIFGFTLAVLAGFLGATAPPPARVRWEPALVLLWLAARALSPFCAPPCPIWSAIDLAFLPLAAIAFSRRNALYWILAALLFSGNLMVHAELFGYGVGFGRIGLYLGLDTVLVLIAVVAGRQLPARAAEALPGYAFPAFDYLDWAAIAATVLYLPVDALIPFSDLTTSAAAVAAVFHLVRFWRWRDPRIWQRPSLWALYVGYLWLIAGFALRVYANLFSFPVSVLSHAFTTGVIGVLGYALMVRAVTPLSRRSLTAGVWLLNLSAVAQVFLPFYWPVRYDEIVIASGVLWLAAFAVFALAYAPRLFAGGDAA